MRLNRGTIALVVVGLIVIAGVLVFNNNQANTPDATPTATQQTGGPLFIDLTADTLARVEVRDNTNGARTVLMRTSEGLWELEEPDVAALDALAATVEPTAEATDMAEVTPEATSSPESTPEPELDQDTVLTTINGLIGLNASDRFDSDQLEGFGLDHPLYSIIVTSEDGTVYMLHIGGENPSGNRYYTVQEQLSVDDLTPEPSLSTEQPDTAATEEATEEAEETEIPTTETAEDGETVSTEEADSEATPEATEEATAEATSEAGSPLEPFATPTPAPLAEPLVVLEGMRTINTIPKTTIDQLIGYIASPPYFVPTPTPTLPFALPEFTPEVTPGVDATIEATEEATAEPTLQPTARATRAATAEPTTRPTAEATEEATAEATSES